VYKNRVYSIALYFFHGDHAMAGDITQHVFLKLMTNIGQFRGDSEFSTWLYRMVVNASMDAARRHKSDQAVAVSSPPHMVSGSGTQEDEYAREELAASVRAAVSRLPPKIRMAVLLRYFDDLSYQQMAQALDCAEGTVASRLNRGHKLLADRLKSLNSVKR